jgi:hypothetical protein
MSDEPQQEISSTEIESQVTEIPLVAEQTDSQPSETVSLPHPLDSISNFTIKENSWSYSLVYDRFSECGLMATGPTGYAGLVSRLTSYYNSVEIVTTTEEDYFKTLRLTSTIPDAGRVISSLKTTRTKVLNPNLTDEVKRIESLNVEVRLRNEESTRKLKAIETLLGVTNLRISINLEDEVSDAHCYTYSWPRDYSNVTHTIVVNGDSDTFKYFLARKERELAAASVVSQPESQPESPSQETVLEVDPAAESSGAPDMPLSPDAPTSHSELNEPPTETS